MAIINPSFFSNPQHALNTEFGIPSCILEFGAQAFGAMSTGTLMEIQKSYRDARDAARSGISNVLNEIYDDLGIFYYDAGTGKLTLFGPEGRFGVDTDFMKGLAEIAGTVNAIGELIEEGQDLYEEVLSCIEDYEAWKKSTNPSTGLKDFASPMTVGGGEDPYTKNAREAEFAIQKENIAYSANFIERCNVALETLGSVLDERQSAEVTAEDEGPIFRLVFGPPVSEQGLFVLSEDGLYYDSQTRTYNGKPLPAASDIGFVVGSDKWRMDHAPNLGGKGTLVSLDAVNQYVNTIFDLEHIDDSRNMEQHYQADTLIEMFQGQKDRMMYDASTHVTELIASGYPTDSAMVYNYKQNIYAINDSFNRKINKRKKQIEVAVKAPDLFGSDESFAPGDVPINDFSFLSSINLDIAVEDQTSLMFEAGDVEDVVLPIQPKFVRNVGATAKTFASPVIVPPVGVGSIVFNPSVSSTTAPALSLTDSIATDGLFAIYNFLKADATKPSSKLFPTRNTATKNEYGNAQLVGTARSLFTSGLGIPYLGGVANLTRTYDLAAPQGFVRLPSIPEFQNLFYQPAGCSIDCWLHIPNYGQDGLAKEKGQSTDPLLHANGKWADYNYYKILLANENTGGFLGIETVSSLVDVKGSETTRGLLMGFTRDPSIYSDFPLIPGPNTDPGKNISLASSATLASACFFIAPTMSVDSSTVEFIPKNNNCVNDGYYKMTVKENILNGDGSGVGEVSAAFVHLHVSFDVRQDLCTVYLDGTRLTSSAISDVLGGKPNQSPKLPTFISPKTGEHPSFYYSSATVNQVAAYDNYGDGPGNDTYFTPWIVGGGWTTGLPINSTTLAGGFMGPRHGLTCGLEGHVGSMKFYSRPLSNGEVLTNYRAQRGFFKNIKL